MTERNLSLAALVGRAIILVICMAASSCKARIGRRLFWTSKTQVMVTRPAMSVLLRPDVGKNVVVIDILRLIRMVHHLGIGGRLAPEFAWCMTARLQVVPSEPKRPDPRELDGQ